MLKTIVLDHLFDKEQPSGVVTDNFVEGLRRLVLLCSLIFLGSLCCCAMLIEFGHKALQKRAQICRTDRILEIGHEGDVEEARNSFLKSLQSMEKGFLLN